MKHVYAGWKYGKYILQIIGATKNYLFFQNLDGLNRKL